VYDVLGRIVTLTHANGATAGYSYNAAGWVTSLVNAKSSATTITSHAYSYDAVGNPVGMTEANGDVLTWTYDALNQLTREQRSGDNAYDLTYTYDPVGNRATKLASGVTTTYTYDAANELTLEDAAGAHTTYTYDENGNTLVWNAAGSRTTLTWGYEDEVLTVQPASGDPVTMTYDGDHMRRQRAEGAATAKYLWDGAQILLDLDGSDAMVARVAALATNTGAQSDVRPIRAGQRHGDRPQPRRSPDPHDRHRQGARRRPADARIEPSRGIGLSVTAGTHPISVSAPSTPGTQSTARPTVSLWWWRRVHQRRAAGHLGLHGARYAPADRPGRIACGCLPSLSQRVGPV
jgi:YD repeat-containing protein